MTDNPYESPSSGKGRADAGEPTRRSPRPPGVSILAVLHLLGGLLLFGAQFIMFARLDEMADSLRMIGMPPALLLAGVMFLALITIASGVGMWLGTKWGWWCAAFYYVYSVFRNGSALFTVLLMADQLDGVGRGSAYYVVKHGLRIVVHFLLLLYFFKGHVLSFFRMETINKPASLGILISICAAITAVSSAIGLFFN